MIPQSIRPQPTNQVIKSSAFFRTIWKRMALQITLCSSCPNRLQFLWTFHQVRPITVPEDFDRFAALTRYREKKRNIKFIKKADYSARKEVALRYASKSSMRNVNLVRICYLTNFGSCEFAHSGWNAAKGNLHLGFRPLKIPWHTERG